MIATYSKQILLWSIVGFASQVQATQVQVVEISDFKFTADSFFAERKDVSFVERNADPKFIRWAEESIGKVNRLIDSKDQLSSVKIKLIFSASVKNAEGKVLQTPISIVESYQEPKTSSIRLGMKELSSSESSFKLTVAHEYAHLIFENASRLSGVTPSEAENIPFWPKSVYEGVADLTMSLALDSSYTGEQGLWFSRNLDEFNNLADARAAKDKMVSRANEAFKKMGLLPSFPIYQDWLNTVASFIKNSGGADPYAEGIWLAGSLRKEAAKLEKKKQLIGMIVEASRSGKVVTSIQSFHDMLADKLK